MGEVFRLPAGWQPDDMPDPAADTEDIVLAELDVQRLRHLLANLPEVDRRVLRWSYGFDGDPLTLRQIATHLGVSLGTAHTIKHRALAVLRGQWGRAA
jgi:RNA polymerase sigma factor (sigma-70 family)